MLIIGNTYTREDGTEITIGGVTKRYPHIVWGIGGEWFDRLSGRYVFTYMHGPFCLLIRTWRDIKL